MEITLPREPRLDKGDAAMQPGTRCIERERDSEPNRPAQSDPVAPSESSSSAPPLTHYAIVRDDLPKGVFAAHLLHAAGESGPAPPGSIAVALAVADEAELLRVAAKLEARGVPHVLIYENAGPYDGQATAIGIHPVADRRAIRKVTSALPLVR